MRGRRDRREAEKRSAQTERESLRELAMLDGKKRHTLRKLSFWALGLLAAACIAAFFVFDIANWQTLDIDKLTRVKQTGAMYDSAGERFTDIKSTENRTMVALASLPAHVKNAFIAAEDLRFYRHPGFDIVRIFGSVVSNVKSGEYAEGASTITQQLIKLSHLSAEKTLARKAEEVYLAVCLEQAFTKDEILEMYMNYIYFGRGAYGVQTAAQSYFGVDAAALSPAQAASLAATVKAPSAYAPHLAPDTNKSRRAYILATMRDNNMLDESAYQAAIAEEITPVAREEDTAVYGWYSDAVLAEAETLLGISAEALLGGGYHIYTALSREHQDAADAEYKEHSLFAADASDGEKAQSAMACVDVRSGAVRAIVGGREYTVARGLNRATQIRRQPGSSLKPLCAYAPAIERGYTTASVLNDTPTKFGNYSPRNSGNAYYGNVTFRTALKYSLNVAAVSLLSQIGVTAARDYMQKVGLAPDVRDANLSLALGSMTYGVSPLQLAAAYAPFANGGTYYEPYFIERIVDAHGQTLYEHQTTGARVCSAQTAYLMTNLLQSVTASGTGAKLSGAGTPVAGKTGTVNMQGGGNRDIWMAAYNPDVATAFWMGFDNPDSAHRLQSWVSGGDYTAALATRFFKTVYTGKNKPDFQSPGGLVWLKIDTKSIEWAGEPMLASSLTPKAYQYSEVFLANNHPTKESTVWRAPRAVSGFYVTHNDAGNPVLVITPSDAALCRVQRDAVGESFILTERYGGAGETIYVTDTSAKVGVVYTYRIIPVHQELLNNGVLLEGPQVFQIAQARPPSAGSILDQIGKLLFEREPAAE